MKLRRQTIDIPDAIEREVEEAVRLRDDTKNVHGPSETYFANLLVRTNERLDRATSGVAISLSWLARVAVPGVVAIIFFFIGLHYYAPVMPRPTVAEVVKSLPPVALDSLLAQSSSDAAVATLVQPSLFDVSNDQLAEFYLETGSPLTILELLSEQELDHVATILEARSANL